LDDNLQRIAEYNEVIFGGNMSDQEQPALPPGKGGVFQDLALRIRLIGRLLADNRISFFLKLLPVGSFFYLLIPDIAPGPLDDIAIVWLGAYLFVELCPPDIVQEHIEALTLVVPGEWRDPLDGEGDIIDLEFDTDDEK
jgi:hypothetical protein